jgi:hypothetical protein
MSQWDVLIARLNALRKNLPNSVSEAVVVEYNRLVHDLQVSSRDEGLVAFRIPDDRLDYQITGSIRPTARRPSGSVSYSDERYCDDDYFKRQVEGLWGYLAERSTATNSKQRTYWDMNDDELETLAIGLKIPYVNISPDGSWHINRTVIIDELVKRDKYLRDMNPQPSSSITVHGSVYNSNLQQGDRSTATINYKAMESDVLRVLAGIERSIDDMGLSPADKGELVADVGTVKAQLNSPNPKTSVITECFRSMRHILEHAGGAAMAHGLIAEVVRLLSHH